MSSTICSTCPALLTITAATVLMGAQCEPHPEPNLETYTLTRWTGDPFDDPCAEEICPPEAPDCGGEEDLFTLDIESDRDRYVLFQTDCAGCRYDDPHLMPGWGRISGGRYAYFGGMGELETAQPLGWDGEEAPVGRVRRYDRGACSYSIDLEGQDMGQRVGELVCHELESVRHRAGGVSYTVFDRCSVEHSEAAVFLSSGNCGDPQLESSDYILVHARVRPHTVWWRQARGHFIVNVWIWWRTTAGARDDYLCHEDGRCPERTACDPSVPSSCSQIPGAECDPTGRCVNPHSIQLDGGFDFEIDNRCRNAVCREIRRATRSSLDDYVEEPRRAILSRLLEMYEEELWIDAGGARCESDQDCTLLGFPYEIGGMTARCGDAHRCQVRPLHVYGVNTYPAELEFVLARDMEDLAFHTIDIGFPRLCAPSPSPPSSQLQSSTWLQGQWP